MRNFTLPGLLVTVCIALIIFAKYEIPVAQKGQQMKPVAQEIAGRGEDGQDAGRSITYEADYKGNQLKGLIVKTLVPGGAMEKHFGLQVGDEIVQIGEMTVDTYPDDATAEAMVQQDAFSGGKALKVIRNGQTLILPKGANPDGSSNLPEQLRGIHLP